MRNLQLIKGGLEYSHMTPKKMAAVRRNWKIYILRGMWARQSLLGFNKEERDCFQYAINSRLVRLGAEPEGRKRSNRLFREALNKKELDDAQH